MAIDFTQYDFSTPEARRIAWTEILKLPEFHQVQHTLRRGSEDNCGYCCLGVATEIYRQVTGEGHWGSDGFHSSEDDFEDSVLPIPVAEWYGFFNDLNPEVQVQDVRAAIRSDWEHDLDDDDVINASDLNDDYDLSFSEIAGAFANRFRRESEYDPQSGGWIE